MTYTLVLLRHGESDWNAKNLFTGWVDVALSEKRVEEALGLKASLSLRGIGEQTPLTLEIRDFDQLDSVVDRLTRR